MYSHSPLPQSPQSPQFARRVASQGVPPYSPQYVHQLSPQYASPYSPYYSSQGSPQFVPYTPPPFGNADTDNTNAAASNGKKYRRPSPAPTWAFVMFRIVTIALSVPLIYAAAGLIHRWPSLYTKTSIGLVAAFLAIACDLTVIKLFYDRSKYFSSVLIPESAVVILTIVSIVQFIHAGLSDADDAVLDDSATERLLGLAFSFIVCGVRIFSMIINSIVACMMRSQSPARPRSRTVFVVQPTEDLY